jgi:hypothetical protein
MSRAITSGATLRQSFWDPQSDQRRRIDQIPKTLAARARI